MNLENIVFEQEDTLQEKATKIVYLFAGTSDLKSQMQKLCINYTKVERQLKVMYILRHNSFGRVVVTL